MNAHKIVRHLTDSEDTKNICLTVVLKSGEHEIETLLQTDGHPTWSLCGGHQKDDETSEEAAERELKEESGIETSVEWLADLPNHCIRNRPARVFYAAVDTATEAVAGSDVKKVKWVPVTALGTLNADDKRLIQMAVKKVHDPDALVKDAIAESAHHHPVTGLCADIAPRGTKGFLIALEGGDDIRTYSSALAAALKEQGTPYRVIGGKLSLIAEEALDKAHRLRRLNPITEALIKAADALHRWENQIRPALEMNQFVIAEHWVDRDRKACVQRGLEPDIFEALFRFLPKPDVTLRASGDVNSVVDQFKAIAK